MYHRSLGDVIPEYIQLPVIVIMKNINLKNGFLVTDDADKPIKQHDVILCDGRIDLSPEAQECEKVMDLGGKYILPGFVDIHFHGYNLFEFTSGFYDLKKSTYDNSSTAYEQGFEMLRTKLAQFGVTGFYLASGAESTATLKHCYRRLADYLSRPDDNTVGARLLGGMLEGPFINPDMSGAMNPELVLEPSLEIFDAIEDGGTIKLANVMPDAGRKSCELTEYLTQKGIVVGAGHTNATFNQMAEAVKAGLKYCVHFTNGPTGGSYKPFEGGGAIEAGLKIDELYAELICDGFHINPAYVRDIIKRKGVDKILGITDCMFVAGSDLKEFSIGGMRGAVSDDGTYLRVLSKENTLFGSNLTMDRAFENMLNWLSSPMAGIWNRRHRALSLEEAVSAAAKMYSRNPCDLTGLAAEDFGRIENGAKADICVLDITGSPGSYKVKVEMTVVDGKVVYSKS